MSLVRLLPGVLLALPSLALATPKLPKLPPREGILSYCPSQEVLATRFNSQSDANGGGFGYYAAAYDENRQARIVNPSQKWVTDYVNGQAAGRVPDANEKATFLWGLRCAYPELEYVETAWTTARAEWIKETGVSEQTEAAWHTLQVDWKKAETEGSAACPNGDSWHTEDPGHLARQYLLCGGLQPAPALGNLLDAWDVTPDPVVAAGIVAECASTLPQQGDGRAPKSAYWAWRACERVAATSDHGKLDAALKAAGTSDWVRVATEVQAEQGQAKLDALTPTMRELEKGWPASPKMFDAAVAQVDEKYVPMLTKWRATLDEADVFTDQLRGGPGYAEGCTEKWSGEVKRYLADSGVKAQGSALWEVLREPVGVGLLEVYALCRGQTGFGAYAEMVAQDALAGVHRVTRWHRGLLDALESSVRGDGTWQGQPLPPELQQIAFPAQFQPDMARQWLRVPDKAPEKPYSYEETVSSVTVDGEVATIRFPKRSGTTTVPTNCSPDYSHVARIDEFGRFWYDWKCAGSKTVPVNETFRPVEVPAWEVAKITAGTRVAVDLVGQGTYYRVEEGGPSAVQGDVVWVKKGEDIIWAAGFAAP